MLLLFCSMAINHMFIYSCFSDQKDSLTRTKLQRYRRRSEKNTFRGGFDGGPAKVVGVGILLTGITSCRQPEHRLELFIAVRKKKYVDKKINSDVCTPRCVEWY